MGQEETKLQLGRVSHRLDKTTGERVAVLRTSDRLAFKHCRRKWDWTSHLRNNLQTIVTADPLWTGSGMHYALEDYHGTNVYGSPAKAFMAYAEAYRLTYPKKVPPDWRDLAQLGHDMMEYYSDYWLIGRDPS